MCTKLTVIYHTEDRVGMARIILTSQTTLEEALSRQVDGARILFVFDGWPKFYNPDNPA